MALLSSSSTYASLVPRRDLLNQGSTRCLSICFCRIHHFYLLWPVATNRLGGVLFKKYDSWHFLEPPRQIGEYRRPPSQPPSSSRNFSAIPRKQSWHLQGRTSRSHPIIGKRCLHVVGFLGGFCIIPHLYHPLHANWMFLLNMTRKSQDFPSHSTLTHIHHLSSQGWPGLTLLVARSSTWKQCIIIIITSNVVKTIINHPQMGCLLVFYPHYYYLLWWLFSW